MNSLPKGILVTGSPRSGTTWVGHMLALAPKTKYLHEPLNNSFTVNRFKEEPFPYWFMYLNNENQNLYLDKVSRMIGLSPDPLYHQSKIIPVIKDPIAVFSTEWLAQTYDLKVVFMIRHPGAVIKSLLTLGWNTEPRLLLSQKPLMDALLSAYDEQLQCYQETNKTYLQAALLWKMIYHAAGGFQERHPDWLFIRHEDLSRDTDNGFREMFSHVGLDYTKKIKKSIAKYSSSKNPVQPKKHWVIKRDSRGAITSWFDYFTKDQISEIRELVEPVSSAYYTDDDWPQD